MVYLNFCCLELRAKLNGDAEKRRKIAEEEENKMSSSGEEEEEEGPGDDLGEDTAMEMIEANPKENKVVLAKEGE